MADYGQVGRKIVFNILVHPMMFQLLKKAAIYGRPM